MRNATLSINLFSLSLLSILAACNNTPAPRPVSEPASRAAAPDLTDAQRLSDGAGKLTDAMKHPTAKFHFDCKGQENVTGNKAKPPQVGPVALQAEISPEEISLRETRGATTRASKATHGDELGWSMANLTTLGVMTHPTLVIALGASVASPPSTDLVGAIPADRFTFDTNIATPAQKRGLESARLVVTTIRDCRGTAWIAKDSGVLIKFNIDADYRDKNNRAWKEHYEGEVTPK